MRRPRPSGPRLRPAIPSKTGIACDGRSPSTNAIRRMTSMSSPPSVSADSWAVDTHPTKRRMVA